jgi:hypothetical protein
MKLVMLIYRGAMPQRLTALLDAHDVGGYTVIENVHGAGATGLLLGTRAWPGEARLLLSLVPADRVPSLVADLKTYQEHAASGEHLHVAVLPVETSF